MTRDEFKQKLKTRILLIRIYLILYVLVVAGIRLYDHFVGIVIDEKYMNFLAGFITGANVMFFVIGAFMHGKYCRALNNKDLFDKLYVAEIDERYAFIKQKSGAEVILPLSIVMLTVGLIAGYFNFTVCITLIQAAIAQLLVCLGLKIYYSKKY